MRTPARAALWIFLPALTIQQALAAESAARLVSIEGSVFVDIGEGFKPVASKAVELQAGNRVLVTQSGAATLRYSEACSLPLEPLSMTTVSEAGCVIGTQGNAQDRPTGGDGTWVAPVVLGSSLWPLGLLARGDSGGSGPSSP